MQLYSPYVKQCIKDLEEFRTIPSDFSAAALVRQQILLERIHQTSWHHKWEPREIHASSMLMFGVFEQDMEQLRQNLRPLDANNGMHVGELKETFWISLLTSNLCSIHPFAFLCYQDITLRSQSLQPTENE